MEKIVCFYHSADLDGKCSGAIVKRHFPWCELIGINYGDEFPWDKIDKDTTVIMVDFSMQPFEGMLELKGACSDFIWIDHHISAIQEAEKYKFGTRGALNTSLAACELTWAYFSDNPTPESVRLLGNYDIWKLDASEDVLPFQYGMRFYNMGPEDQGFWEEAFYNENGFVERTCSLGRTILTYQERQDEIAIKSCGFATEIAGYKALAINKPLSNSATFKALWDSSKYDLMLAFSWKGKYWTVGLYTDKEGIDVSQIAHSFGGGGHRKASGFQCLELPFSIEELNFD